ncbi:SDR family oxidoreductase, partial [Streptomyces sp. NPDC056670]|uniref:SDR family oxidoreductase n=1 Tax=Streptomyces sp. NPDC056670 TaxID=3345904 RepID=UPI0036CD58D3
PLRVRQIPTTHTASLTPTPHSRQEIRETAPRGDDIGTRILAAAAAGAGVKHLVHVSVIGADTLPIGYFRAKLGAERAVQESGVPWTTLRAAQFHDLVLAVAEKLTRALVVPAPTMRLQPVDSREVAARLVELAHGDPSGLVADLTGPRVYEMRELLRTYLAACGKHRPILPVRIPGRAGRAYRADDNLTLREALIGRRSWEDFLAERIA